MARIVKSKIGTSACETVVRHGTWRMRSVPSTVCAIFLSSAITSFTDISIPRRTSVGFIPAATALHPSRKIDRVRIVAEVVPASHQFRRQPTHTQALSKPCGQLGDYHCINGGEKMLVAHHRPPRRLSCWRPSGPAARRG